MSIVTLEWFANHNQKISGKIFVRKTYQIAMAVFPEDAKGQRETKLNNSSA